MKRIIGIILTVMLLVSMAVTAAAEPNTDLSGEISIWVWGDYEEKGAMDFNQYYGMMEHGGLFARTHGALAMAGPSRE